MKTKEELLQFYGIEEGKKYVITKASNRIQKMIQQGAPNYINKKFSYLSYERNDVYIKFEDMKSLIHSPFHSIYFLKDFEYEEVEESILTDEEKEYLSTVIKPFRKLILTICKYNDNYNEDKEYEYISITYNELNENHWLLFPYFKSGTMYKNMKLGKRYTLKELGL